MKTISIILPCYQAHNFIADILSDICNQEYSNWELICISNGPTQEKQLDILCKWKKKDERIKLLTIPPTTKGSVSRARNLGIEESKGEWVCFVDADDRLTPNHLSLMVEAVDDDTEVVYGGITQRMINEKNNENQNENQNGNDNPKMLDTSNIVNALLDNDNVSGPCNVLIRKSLLKDLRFNEEYTYGEDAIFKLHLLNKTKHIRLIPLTGYIYVRDASNASAVDRYHETMEDANNEKFELLGEILKKYEMDEVSARKTIHKLYYDVALVPILTNPFHINTPLSLKGKYKRIKDNFFSNRQPAIIFRECNLKSDSNPFYRLLRMGYKLHSCLFVTVILQLFYSFKYRNT